MTGIYKIQSLLFPDKIYIGSAFNFKVRWRRHLWYLKNNKHHSSKLQRHYNKYGENDLSFSIITKCHKSHLISIEQFYIDSLNPFFNECRVAGNTSGRKFSEETKHKLSLKSKGNKGRKGLPLSEEHKRKLSESMSGANNHQFGKPSPRKGKKGYPNKNKGKHGIYSEETLTKMSISNKRAWEIRKLKKVA